MEKMPCDPQTQAECPVFQVTGQCFEDLHHEYWPRAQYRTKIEKDFRQLEVNKAFICRAVHNEIHARTKPPFKPSRDVMVEILRREREARKET